MKSILSCTRRMGCACSGETKLNEDESQGNNNSHTSNSNQAVSVLFYRKKRILHINY